MKNFLFILMFVYPGLLEAQYNYVGQAYLTADSCIVLTENEYNKVGAFWNLEKVNLEESFSVQAELYFGSRDAGADGIVFALQPVSNNAGSAGGGIGIQNINPALFVEMDTWQNGGNSDPSFDHIAIMKNGNLDHNSSANLAGPVACLSSNGNIENDEFYKFQINWIKEQGLLEVFFDCNKVLSYQGDLINEIFKGDPEVFWGFTAATGGERNKQMVCLKFASFESNLEDVVLCRGGKTQLNAIGGTSYLWTPAEGLSADNIPNPVASPPESTVYTVEIKGDCGEVNYDEVEIIVDGSLTDLDIGPDTSLCDYEELILDATLERATAYAWSDGSTEPTLIADYSSLFSVTVTVDEECITEDWLRLDVTATPFVNLGEDSTLCLQSDPFRISSTFTSGEFLWNDGSQGNELLVTEEGYYSLKISNECGVDYDEVFFDFEDCRSIYIPNSFSPNADGINDEFEVFTDGDVQEVLSFQIYDRWGNALFHESGKVENNAMPKWDGSFRGESLQSGVYIYVISVLFRDGGEELFKGDLQLFK